MKNLNKEITRKWLLSHRQAYLFSKIGWIAVGMKPKFIKNPKLQKIRERIKNKTQNKKYGI